MTLLSPSGIRPPVRRRPSRDSLRVPSGALITAPCLAATFAAALGASCNDQVAVVRGTGSIVQEKRVLRPIEKIAIDGDFDVTIEVVDGAPLELVAHQIAARVGEPEVESAAEGVLATVFGGPQTIVWIEGPDDLIEHVETEFRRDCLHIGLAPDLRLDPMPTIEIRTQALSSLSSNGSGTVKLHSARLDDVPLENLVLSCRGAGDVEAIGRVKRLEVDQTGSGDLRLMELWAEEVEHSSVGSGDAYLFVDRVLRTNLIGSGDVVIRGDPKCYEDIRGSGQVLIIDERVKSTRASSPR